MILRKCCGRKLPPLRRCISSSPRTLNSNINLLRDELPVHEPESLQLQEMDLKIENHPFPDRMKDFLPYAYWLKDGQSFDMHFKLTYFDSSHMRHKWENRLCSSKTTVLCIHGSPGSHKDFAGTLWMLTKAGARVICPNLPGFGKTVDLKGNYWQSAIERQVFLQSFLREIDVRKIDLLLAYSAGNYVAIPLIARYSDEFHIKRFGMLNPGGHIPYKGVRGYWNAIGPVGAQKVGTGNGFFPSTSSPPDHAQQTPPNSRQIPRRPRLQTPRLPVERNLRIPNRFHGHNRRLRHQRPIRPVRLLRRRGWQKANAHPHGVRRR